MASPARWSRMRSDCPICGHRGWCTISGDGTAVNCPRTPSAQPIYDKKTGEEIGYIHKLTGQNAPAVAPRRAPSTPKIVRSCSEWLNLSRRFKSAVVPDRLEAIAAYLTLSVNSLNRLDIGWATAADLQQLRTSGTGAWTFPMFDADGRVIGIRLREPPSVQKPRKYAVTGSANGLFIPLEFEWPNQIAICEGPTSTAALLDFGFHTIGRPSCNTGAEMLKQMLRARSRRDLIIFGDNDDAKKRPNGSEFYPGQEGAFALAKELRPIARSVKVIIPPFYKDARAWKQAGATRAVVQAVINAANYFT